jgi:hypothetical protein
MANASKISVYADLFLEDNGNSESCVQIKTPCDTYTISGIDRISHAKIGEYRLTATGSSGNSIDVFTREPEDPPSEYVRVLISNVLITDDPGIALIVSVQYVPTPSVVDDQAPLPVIRSETLFLPQQFSIASILPAPAPFQFAFANLIGFSATEQYVQNEQWTTNIYPNAWTPYYRSKHAAVAITEISHESIYVPEEQHS